MESHKKATREGFRSPHSRDADDDSVYDYNEYDPVGYAREIVDSQLLACEEGAADPFTLSHAAAAEAALVSHDD